MWWKPTDQQLGLNSLPAGQRDLDPRDGLLVGHGPCVLHHLGPVLDLHVIWQTRTKKNPKKAVLLKIKWQLVWLSQQSDQSWSCVYFVTLNECFFYFFFFFKTCLQPKHWKIYKPRHKTPLVFLLGTWWFNIWKSFALTNSVYLQRHHTTLIAWCQLITFGIKSAALPKISAAGCPKHERIPSYAGSRRLGAGPIRRTGYIETSWRGAHFTCNALSTTPTW